MSQKMDKKKENGFSLKSSQAGGTRKQLPYTVETPYGYQLDLDFLKYVEDIERGKTIKKIHIHRRNKGPKFSTLPRNFSLPATSYQSGSQHDVWASSTCLGSGGRTKVMEVQQLFDFQASDSRSAAFPKAGRTGHASRKPMDDASIRAFDEQPPGIPVRPHLLRASSMPATVLQRKNSELDDQELQAAWEPSEENSSSENVFCSSTAGDGRSPSQQVNVKLQQLHIALKRIRELEEEVQTIPELKAQIRALKEENDQCLLTLSQKMPRVTPDSQKRAAEASKASSGTGSVVAQLVSPSAFQETDHQCSESTQQVQDHHETSCKDSSAEAAKLLDARVETQAEQREEAGDTVKLQEATAAVKLGGNMDLFTTASLQAKLVALELKFAESSMELQRVNALLRDQMEENRLMKERLKQKEEKKLEKEERDQKSGDSVETKLPSDYFHTSEAPRSTNVECEATSEKRASIEVEACLGESSNKQLEDLKTTSTQTDPTKTQDAGVLVNVATAEKLVEATVAMCDIAVNTDSGGKSSSGLAAEDVRSEAVEAAPLEAASQPEANPECASKDHEEEAQPQGESEAEAVEATISQYLSKMQELLEEQWACLPSGPSESIPKDLTSKISSIHTELVSTVSALSSICCTSEQTAAPTKDGALRSIMKKKSSAERLGNRGTKKNLKFVGVNGGYETTSSEDSSEEDNAEVDVFESEEQKEIGDKQEEVSKTMEPDNAITPPGPDTGSQTKQAGRKVMDEKFLAACRRLTDHLEELDSPDEEMREVLATLYKEWFRVSSRRASRADTVALYLGQIGGATPSLLRVIVNLADGNGNTALHYSVSHGNFHIVKLLLDTGLCEVNQQNEAGYSAIMLAALAVADLPEDVGVAMQLMGLGDVNARAGQGGQTALMLAASHGRVAMVRPLLDCGADPSMRDHSGATALMCACEQGHTDVARVLLECAHCDVGVTDDDGNTALSLATKASHSEIVDLLRSHTVSEALDTSVPH
ncbi:KN motif and ankyrin repeat domain-containing protein 4-like [Brienomyrus brachyistius]|uniref:KN motif and ankyrin repeat domain-containing protein 4-like n=1 Tax=Brienomyrus brachyistius TaxID=42636 RepID=UPI0020B1BAEC|nr:KN motif and ankyrin repeat domain-containing protein 4-like [Brienomyrus brachyistius]XP_048844687.1 KN motif and ankyrin repeat domain-containing protein 4-like [Brienomyrus brachyistius]XP_048844688.1 KN motif and ankyrin repeat domain-containing protein 4-like [Brienomyrus brachyistius]XP_048844689.1 KN motif and ankyrin repeat domain-containing protein 4-like [Brienomyrus brachyistius]XP_048844690.1 KN motif and ankyrin repeat domain-containing protein 4-like [Brienomyrus brachyistius]